MRCFYSQELERGTPDAQAFPAEKFRASKDMLLEGGILSPEEIIEVGSANVGLIERVHAPDYVRAIESGRTFQVITSASLIRRSRASWPIGCLRSRQIERLLRLVPR